MSINSIKTLGKLTIILLLAAATALGADTIPKRIVSLSPSTTEMLYGVGAFSHVVGVSQYDTYPPQVAQLPRVGGWETSDIEKILGLRPDLIVMTEAQVPLIEDRLRAFNLHFIAVPSETLADVFTAIQDIGKATGKGKEASELTSKMHASLDAIRSATKNLPKRSVLLAIDRTPGTLSDLYVATDGSFLIDLIDIAGGRSVATPARTGYGKISKEAVLALNPDVIIDFVQGSTSILGEHTTDAWNDLPELRAVREKHVYGLDDPFIPHPSQFVTHTAEVFERILHPEAVSKGEH